MPLSVVRNDITKMMVDAIVNTADRKPRFGSGTDEAIYTAAGIAQMTAARLQIGEIKPGRCAATPAFRLEENGVKYVLHTVYLDWFEEDEWERAVLRQAYTSALELAAELGCQSVGIPLLGAGNRGYPIDVAIDEALAAIYAFLHEHDMQIYLVLFSMLSIREARRLFPDIPSFVDDKYVMQRTFEDAEEAEEADEAPTAVSQTASDRITLRYSVPEKGDTRQEETLIRMFDRLSEERNIRIGDVYNMTSISRQVLSKVRSNPDYHLGKRKAMELAILLRLSPEEAADFLARGDHAFNPTSRFDQIVLQCLNRKVFNLFAIDEVLYDAGETPFCDF
ncbi:MAG: macro domain-containing protein [Oscillospiraceae bacterium]|nr:macro domain-containing protein [Oscillospiraceae bacterium]MBR3849697.1 macro domain-containing protein [Oscillospiraceae bacterium]